MGMAEEDVPNEDRFKQQVKEFSDFQETGDNSEKNKKNRRKE